MKTKRWISLMAAGVLGASSLIAAAGCGKEKVTGANALEVYACSLGYGAEWLDKALESFKNTSYVKEKYPNFTYSITTNDEYAFGQSQVLSGVTTYDVLFASTFSPQTVETPGKNGKKSILEDITDVFNGKIPDFKGGYEKNEDGEDWTYGEKLKAGAPGRYKLIGYEEEVSEGEYEMHYYYTLLGSGMYGILYNRTKLEEYGFITTDAQGNVQGLPRTTDELRTFAIDIANKGYTPFVAAKDTGYWTRVQNLWWAQYEGAEAYDRYFQGQYKNDVGEWDFGVEVLRKAKGRLLANQITESLLKYDNEPRLIHDESSALDFTTAQSYLISGKGLMQANGTWFDNEMKSLQGQAGADAEIRLMPNVMISAIKDVVPDKSIENDSELSALVGAIASGNTALEGTYDGKSYSVTQADYNRVKDAYNLYNTGESISPTLIPSYSDAIDLAKDFLRYLATDDFCRMYMETTGGNSPAVYYDVEKKDPALYASFSAMNKDRLAFIEGKQTILQYKTCNYPLVYRTGYASFGQGYEIKYMSKNAKDRKSAAECIEEQIATYEADDNAMWELMLSQAGLK